jgi:hypothetical protein
MASLKQAADVPGDTASAARAATAAQPSPSVSGIAGIPIAGRLRRFTTIQADILRQYAEADHRIMGSVIDRSERDLAAFRDADRENRNA